MTDQFLFPSDELEGEGAAGQRPARAAPLGKPRLRVPQRQQMEMRCASLDQLLDPEHQARVVWEAVCGLDLSRWLAEVRAVEGHVGRDATDPRLLVAIWVYATLDGVGSTRKLAELCEKHVAYQWLCGGVTVNHTMLSEFRSQHGDKWEELLTQIVAGLLAAELVSMQCVAQDGMKVRASAGKSSFRRRASLEECLDQARQQVAALQLQADEEPTAVSKREQAARQRAARERAQRVEEALRNCEELQRQREASAKKSCRKVNEARASTTDPEARVMQFSDGGYRPGYNVQFTTDTGSGVIVGVAVTNAGNDQEQLPPMLKQLEKRYGRKPERALVDGGFASREAIEQATAYGTAVYAPLKDAQKQLAAGKDPYAAKKGDTAAMLAWRERMKDASSQALYRLRCQTAEWVNAVCRNRGFWRMPLRGVKRCRIQATLYAITHDLILGAKLAA